MSAAPRSPSSVADVVVVGAGIVGLTTARALFARRPERRILVVDKEPTATFHQSGRNSGVIHSGIYYPPESGKASMCAAGRKELIAFLDQHAIAYEICGKVIVAVEEDEIPRLDALEARAEANGVATERLDRIGLHAYEPHVRGVAALRVPSAGIVDFARVGAALVDELTETGVDIRFGVEVQGAEVTASGVRLRTSDGEIVAGSLVNCAGLHCDRVARAAGADTDGVRIMPFRGEYYELADEARHLVTNLVYPLPDPDFPFLGVHLTRMIDGSIHAGPNAVPAFKREGYRWRDVSVRDAAEIVFARGTWKLARSYWRKELGEIHRSLRRTAFLQALRRLCPDVELSHLVPTGAGVRAQAIDRAGNLLDDFAFAQSPRAVHVLNAPSPAATASFAIAAEIAARHHDL